MKGIILAAGRGMRLNGEGGVPKCLVKIGGMSLIKRQLRALNNFGIDDIIIVVGYEADRVRRECGYQARYIENPIFDRTNSLYSLWLTRDMLADGFVVMNSDVLFHPQMLEDLIEARYEDALLISYRNETDPPFTDEEMKVKVRGGKVIDISKAMETSEADGENVGIVKFGPSGAELLAKKMDALIADGGNRDWAPRAFCDFASERPMHAIGTRGFPWIEIDFPEDYRRAVNEVFPEILIGEEMDEMMLALVANAEV